MNPAQPVTKLVGVMVQYPVNKMFQEGANAINKRLNKLWYSLWLNEPLCAGVKLVWSSGGSPEQKKAFGSEVLEELGHFVAVLGLIQ